VAHGCAVYEPKDGNDWFRHLAGVGKAEKNWSAKNAKDAKKAKTM